MRDSVNQWTLQWALNNKITAHFIDKTDSTNTWAKGDFNGPVPAVYLADFQHKGRGRNANTWTTEKAGDGLLSTWCFKASSTIPYIFSVRIGNAVYKALKSTWPHADFSLKAPNDVYIQNKKLAGLLIEVVSQTDNTIFIGLGLNFENAPESTEFQSTALTLHAAVDQTQWNVFCATLFALFQDAVNNTSPLLSASESTDILIGLRAHYGTHLTRIDPDATLVFSDGTQKVWKEL